MIGALLALFRPQKAADVLHEQLQEAERMQVMHYAAAEHHAALAGMYTARIERIRKAAQVPPTVRVVK